MHQLGNKSVTLLIIMIAQWVGFYSGNQRIDNFERKNTTFKVAIVFVKWPLHSNTLSFATSSCFGHLHGPFMSRVKGGTGDGGGVKHWGKITKSSLHFVSFLFKQHGHQVE